MTHWFVITPSYTTYYNSWSLDPPEYGCDVVSVDAPTKRQAKVEGVRKLRAIKSEWIQDAASDGVSPFTGLKVETTFCPHNVACHCDLKECTQKECAQCDKEWEEELAKENDGIQSSS
jgi:hypothetical protein